MIVILIAVSFIVASLFGFSLVLSIVSISSIAPIRIMLPVLSASSPALYLGSILSFRSHRSLRSLLLIFAFTIPAIAQLDSLPNLPNFQAHRATSADPTGGNADWRELAPGQTLTLLDINGSGRIVHFRDNITSNERGHLQKHVLRMYWDGEESPSVEVPVGDFFGVGFGFTEKYASALMCIDDRRGDAANPASFGTARNCYILMPFAKHARITITNEGKESSKHWYEVNYQTFDKPQENVGYFHAQYRQATPPINEPVQLVAGDMFRFEKMTVTLPNPYIILEATGHGQLIGCVLSVLNRDGGWWGEGDELLQIDDKEAINGTGTEDYFCESYGLRFGAFPYFGVTVCQEPYATAYRWHVPDPVPFTKSIRFSIEYGNGASPFKTNNFYYCVAYWYQTEPHAPFPKLPTAEERTSPTSAVVKSF